MLLEKLIEQKRAIPCRFHEQLLILDARAVIYWPTENALIVSDLHLEKGSYYARFASPLPHYDSLDTLLRLESLIELYHPDKVICLGDSFHDSDGFERLSDKCKAKLFSVCHRVKQWVWILGNHDPLLDASIPGQQLNEIRLAGITLRHEHESEHTAQIIGHYHPKLSHSLKRRKVTGKSFVLSENLLIMPAFGSYTGGLNVNGEAIRELLGDAKPHYFLLSKKQIWQLMH